MSKTCLKKAQRALFSARAHQASFSPSRSHFAGQLNSLQRKQEMFCVGSLGVFLTASEERHLENSHRSLFRSKRSYTVYHDHDPHRSMEK